ASFIGASQYPCEGWSVSRNAVLRDHSRGSVDIPGVAWSFAGADQALVTALLELGDLRVALEEVVEGAVADRLLAEGRVHATHVRLHRGGVQPFAVAAVPELEGALEQPGRGLARVLAALVVLRLLGGVGGLLRGALGGAGLRGGVGAAAGAPALAGRGPRDALGGGLAARGARSARAGALRLRGALHPGQVLVGFELVAGGGEGFRGRAGHAHRDDIAAQAAAALREGDVVGVAGDDHHVGEVRHEVEVLDGVDGQADVGAVLR